MTATAAPIHIPEQHQAAVQAGAECWRCPLLGSGRGPVPSTIPPSAELFVCAEAPGSTEVATGAPLVGASGREIRTALQNAGVDTSRVGLVNAMACQPPGTDLKSYLRQCKKQGLPSPLDCCAPRLRAETANAKFVILMGGAALQAFGVKHSVLQIRGTPLVTQQGTPGLAIPHAAFVLRDEGRVLRPLFHADVAKAVRLSRGGNTWTDPRYFIPRSAAEIENFLTQEQPYWAVDTETDGIDPWTCRLRRIGIGTGRECLIYSPLSVRGEYLIDADNRQAQERAIAAFFSRAQRLVFHNFYQFDSIVLWHHGMPVPDQIVSDTLIGHCVGLTSELPHRLDFLGSVYTDARYWKQDVKFSSVASDDVLDRYLSYDVAVTWLSAPYVGANITSAQQQGIYDLDSHMAVVGRSMAALGIRIDRAAQFKFAAEYQEKATRLRAEFVERAGRDVNPASPVQVRKLLYEDLGLPMLDEHFTDGGDPSTDENTLLDLLGLGLDERGSKIIHALIGYREAEKVLGTSTGHVENGQIVGGPPLHLDGRLRTSWRPGRVTGRWSSGDPVNMQNVQKKLRAMFQPAAGNTFVAADYSALELRIMALLSNDAPMIEAFKAFDAGIGPDVHTLNGCMIFNCTKEQITEEIRVFCKRTIFGAAYGAAAPKIYQTLSLMRDDNLKPLFPRITLSEVERVLGMWWQLHPSIAAWQKKLIYSRRSNGFLASPWHGRKRFFIGGEKAQEEVNFPIQSGAADLQNTAVKKFVEAFPFDYVNHRGVVAQVHDQLVVECRKSEAEDVKRLLESCMTVTIGGMPFPAKGKVGDDWKVVS